MTKDQFRNVHSSLGTFMRRIPKTAHWLSRLKGIDGFTAYSSWAIQPPERTPPSTPPGSPPILVDPSGTEAFRRGSEKAP